MSLDLLQDRYLFDQLGQGALLLDRDRKVLAVNRTAEEQFKLREKDLIGRVCREASGFGLCTEGCPFDEVLTTGENRKVFDFSGLPGAGLGALCLTLSPVRDRNGRIVAVMESLQDATMVKDLNASLEKKKSTLSEVLDRSRAVINSLADGVYTVDLEMRLTGFSRSAEKMTGYCEEEVLGRTCSEVLRSSICQTDCPLKWTLKHRQPIQNCTATLVARDGRRIPAFLNSDLLRDGHGEVCGCIAVIRDRSEVEALRAKLESEYVFGDFVGKSKRMREIFDRVETVAATEATVLIQGESGTGKEILARAIHYRSGRRGGAFVKVNCASLAETLLESELFGHEKGAFTGAMKEKPGRFELADGGTIFLDEIGDTSLALQAKLLRVLQEKEYERVGGIRTRKADVRVIAATNKNLAQEIERGRFREDLYYRLCVVPIQLPPLRDRREDIPLLVEYFIQKFNARGSRIREVSSRAMAALMDYDWPGNVRELENAVEHAYVTSTSGRIERQFLPFSLHRALASAAIPDKEASQGEEKQILQALRENRWHKGEAARRLGISRTTLWRKLKQLGLE